MSLSPETIDRLFDRLSAAYGREFMARWDGIDGNAVKSSWAYELSGFADQLKSIAWALENLPERAPNVIEFRNLCRKAPAPDLPRLPEPAADPARVAAELSRLQPLRSLLAQPHPGSKDWARRIHARVLAGERVNPTSRRLARQALGLEA